MCYLAQFDLASILELSQCWIGRGSNSDLSSATRSQAFQARALQHFAVYCTAFKALSIYVNEICCFNHLHIYTYWSVFHRPSVFLGVLVGLHYTCLSSLYLFVFTPLVYLLVTFRLSSLSSVFLGTFCLSTILTLHPYCHQLSIVILLF